MWLISNILLKSGVLGVGYKLGRLLFIDDGVLLWIVVNVNNDVLFIWCYIELVLCYLV